MSKREFLMLAHDLDIPGRLSAGQHKWMISEKLDGMRAFWDGGITRGVETPIAPGEVATGLWSRYAKIIHAPDTWLDKLPKISLDGELWLGRGLFQETISIVKRSVNKLDYLWKNIQYKCFDMPNLARVWALGEIDNPNCSLVITPEIQDWLANRAELCGVKWSDSLLFYEAYSKMLELGIAHKQIEYTGIFSDLEDKLKDVVAAGGEGLILRDGWSTWVTERSWHMMKLKPAFDSEAEVIGYKWGRKTDKGSKLLGKMGALTLNWNGIIFDLSGFTDEERTMTGTTGDVAARIFGCSHPGDVVSPVFWAKNFLRGTKVTFTYRELTKAGVPREARFLRKHLAL